MTREIKFRAWDRQHREMVSWEQAMRNFRVNEFFEPVDNFEPMQYTGLKDKNGVEIYEGDIVRLTDDWGEETQPHQVKYFADDDYPAFDLEPNIDADANGLSHYKATGDIEVIGNIYENPELLTGGDRE